MTNLNQKRAVFPLQGIPNITVPAGFTTVVYDRIRDDSVDPDSIDVLFPLVEQQVCPGVIFGVA